MTICAQAGMAKLGYVAVDGTKIKANASKHKAMSYGRMKRERKRLRTEIRTYLQECVALDEAEDARYGADKRGDELPEELADPAKRLDAIERAMAALEQQATEKAEQKGKEPSKPKDNAQYNFTDPDSRIMKSAGPRLHPGVQRPGSGRRAAPDRRGGRGHPASQRQRMAGADGAPGG